MIKNFLDVFLVQGKGRRLTGKTSNVVHEFSDQQYCIVTSKGE